MTRNSLSLPWNRYAPGHACLIQPASSRISRSPPSSPSAYRIAGYAFIQRTVAVNGVLRRNRDSIVWGYEA